MTSFFLILGLGTPEIIVIAVVGLLLFGRRLPEVGRSLGKSFVEFKSGLQGIQDEMRDVTRMTDEAARQKRAAPRVEPPADEEALGPPPPGSPG